MCPRTQLGRILLSSPGHFAPAALMRDTLMAGKFVGAGKTKAEIREAMTKFFKDGLAALDENDDLLADAAAFQAAALSSALVRDPGDSDATMLGYALESLEAVIAGEV